MTEHRRESQTASGRLPLWATCALVASIGLSAHAGLAAELPGATPRKVAAPIRLPKVISMGQANLPWPSTQIGKPTVTAPPSQPLAPWSIAPSMDADLHDFEPLPTVELDLGLPRARSTQVGGWISVGYGQGGFGQ